MYFMQWIKTEATDDLFYNPYQLSEYNEASQKFSSLWVNNKRPTASFVLYAKRSSHFRILSNEPIMAVA